MKWCPCRASTHDGAVGTQFGPTAWETVSQERMQQFADATGDHQWIHVDPVRAAAGPFGGCIAHGYLTLSLVNWFLPQLMQVEQVILSMSKEAEMFNPALLLDTLFTFSSLQSLLLKKAPGMID